MTAIIGTDFEPSIGNGSEMLLPEKPIKPSESECCGNGCAPCVFDLYNKALLKWERECQDLLHGTEAGSAANLVLDDIILSPTKYKEFRIIAILPDTCPSSKIFRVNCFAKDGDAKPAGGSNVQFPVAIGQHIVLMICDGDKKIARKYTVLRAGNQIVNTSPSHYFDVLVRTYPNGQLTQLLNKLKEEDTILIRGPFGNPWSYNPNEFKSVIMLAAGTGIAPMYRIIEKILHNEEDDTRINLFYSNKTLQSVMLKTELKEWSTYWNFKVHHFISKEPEESAIIPYGVKVHFHKITQDVIRDNFGSDCESSSLFIICGTNSFEKDMINYIQKIGVNNKRIHVF